MISNLGSTAPYYKSLYTTRMRTDHAVHLRMDQGCASDKANDKALTQQDDKGMEATRGPVGREKKHPRKE